MIQLHLCQEKLDAGHSKGFKGFISNPSFFYGIDVKLKAKKKKSHRSDRGKSPDLLDSPSGSPTVLALAINKVEQKYITYKLKIILFKFWILLFN